MSGLKDYGESLLEVCLRLEGDLGVQLQARIHRKVGY